MIRISSKQDGFRRCGVAHPRTATEYADNVFTEAQLKALQAEPMLVVEVIEGDAGNDGKIIRPNAKDSIAAIQAATTIEDLDKLAEGEERKSVVDAIAKRRAELEG